MEWVKFTEKAVCKVSDTLQETEFHVVRLLTGNFPFQT